MRKKILASLLCLVFLFSIVGMAMAAPQDGFYVEEHRYNLDISKSDPGYRNYLSDMRTIGFDFTRLIIVLNNRFTSARDAVDEGSIDPVLQNNAHQQVGGTIPKTVEPVDNDGNTGSPEPVSSTEKIVTGVAIKTAPTNKTYIAGDKLDLTGLVVILTNSDKTTDEVALANFATNGISTSPANGAILAETDKAVVIKVNGKTANQAITVNPGAVAVTGVSLNADTLNLTAGGATGTLAATVAPADATNKNVTWSSSDESVATVANGVVTPVAVGNATITVTTEDGSFTDTCAVSVVAATVAVTGVSLDADTLNLIAGGDTGTLVATVAPADATNKNVTWSSSDESVATVADGVVTPVAIGNATITVTTEDGNITATCAVTVGPALAINPESYDLNKNAPVNDIPIDITWGPATEVVDIILHVITSSGDPLDISLNDLEAAGNGKFYYVEGNVLTIKKELIGLFDTMGYPLSTIPDGFPIDLNITFDVGVKTFRIIIVDGEAPTVSVTGVTLDQDTLNLTAGGDTGTLVATVAPADATNKNVTWSSSDESVATVANGVVTPVAVGNATITVTTEDGSFTDTCDVTVAPATISVTGVTLDQDTLSLTAGGDTATLAATVAPADATNKNVTWSSSDESIATVADGVVTPVAAGNATITVTTEDGSFTDTCDVTVASAGPTTAVEAIEMAIANFAPASGSGTFTGSIPNVKVAGNVTVEKVQMVPATTTLTSSSVKSSFLDVNIQSANIKDLIVGTVTANNFPFAEIIAGPIASGTSLVTSGNLTSDADNYYIQLTNVNCPQSALDIITAAANLNSKYQMTFKSQKLSCTIKIAKSSNRVVSVDNIVITGTTTITKSSFDAANGDYSNTFNCSSFTVTY